MDEWTSPDGQHTAKWTWGGEMWMSGPEWGYLTVDGTHVFKDAARQSLWSDDSRYLAFVALHIQDTPNRTGAEGFSFRVAILKLPDFQVRWCFGNHGLARIRLESFVDDVLTLSADGERHEIHVRHIEWPS